MPLFMNTCPKTTSSIICLDGHFLLVRQLLPYDIMTIYQDSCMLCNIVQNSLSRASVLDREMIYSRVSAPSSLGMGYNPAGVFLGGIFDEGFNDKRLTTCQWQHFSSP